ncbi:MAG: hypothetical protein KME18_27745 [Phormidium tanganyikae FI6-MK23]|nr:hypothetical protein [Phormidium tanganyikae FI6-MK23]
MLCSASLLGVLSVPSLLAQQSAFPDGTMLENVLTYFPYSTSLFLTY